VWLAVKDALRSYAGGLSAAARLPADGEEILMAIEGVDRAREVRRAEVGIASVAGT